MNTAKMTLPTLVFSIIAVFSISAFADQNTEKTKAAKQQVEKGTVKTRDEADKSKYKAKKQKTKVAKQDTKTDKKKNKAKQDKQTGKKKNKAQYNESGKKHTAKKDKTNPTAQNKQMRKEQSRSIKDDYRAKKGAELKGRQGDSKPAKKPWWKFWQRSDATEK